MPAEPGSDSERIGQCHYAANGFEAISDDAWWCSEHPARQRDRLAAIAMGGLVSAWGDTNPADELAEYSYKVADAMLSARRKAKKEKGL